MLTPGQVITSPDGVNGTEIPVGATVEYRIYDDELVGGGPLTVTESGGRRFLNDLYDGNCGRMTILTLPPGYGAEAGPDAGDELAEAVKGVLDRPEVKRSLEYLDRGIGTATPDAVWMRLREALTRYLSTRPAKGGAV